MSDEEREFASAPTRPCLMVMPVELPGVEPAGHDEVTATRAMCWQHGEFYLSDNGERVRLPVENCTECATGAA
jgi:hypothetical protein